MLDDLESTETPQQSAHHASRPIRASSTPHPKSRRGSERTDFQSLLKPLSPSNAALLSSLCVPFSSRSHSFSIVSSADVGRAVACSELYPARSVENMAGSLEQHVQSSQRSLWACERSEVEVGRGGETLAGDNRVYHALWANRGRRKLHEALLQ